MVVVPAAVGLVVSIVGCAAAIGVLRRFGVVDVPNIRSSHCVPVVRGVGLGVALGVVAGFLAARTVVSEADWSWRVSLVLVIVPLTAGGVGLIDDLRKGVSFRVRLLAQVIVLSVAIVALDAGGATTPWRALLLVVSLVFAVGYVNAFNFMDGVNGISGATGLVAGWMFAMVGHLEDLPLVEAGGAALGGASGGFLPFNFPSARAFLGDVGSYFVGVWIALLALVALGAGVPADVVVAPLALYLADTASTLAFRVVRREQWHAAHRDHAYQRLCAGGLGHTATTLVILVLTVVLSGLGLIVIRTPAWRPVVWPVMVALVLAYLTAPYLLRRRDGVDQSAQVSLSSAPSSPIVPPDRAAKRTP